MEVFLWRFVGIGVEDYRVEDYRVFVDLEESEEDVLGVLVTECKNCF